MTVLLEELTPEVHAFCERAGIAAYLQLAVQLVREHYPEAREMNAEIVHDPDSGEEWMALNIEVPVGVDEMLARDEPFLDRWIAAAPWPERDKIAIMLYPA